MEKRQEEAVWAIVMIVRDGAVVAGQKAVDQRTILVMGKFNVNIKLI